MKIVFLESAVQDIQWFRFYFRSVCPEGGVKARNRMRTIQEILAANPYVGHPSDARQAVRELSIPRTPFVLIYRVMPTQIEVLRLWDTRQGSDY